jgi:hypothetical protein
MVFPAGHRALFLGIPGGGLAGAAMAAPVVRDRAEAVLREEHHLAVPRVGAQRPAVRERDDRACAPVLVVDFRAIFGGDRAHVRYSVRCVGSTPRPTPRVGEVGESLIGVAGDGLAVLPLSLSVAETSLVIRAGGRMPFTRRLRGGFRPGPARRGPCSNPDSRKLRALRPARWHPLGELEGSVQEPCSKRMTGLGECEVCGLARRGGRAREPARRPPGLRP